ncbi:hypothetical protein J31TS4_07550 [Paenibacillus sp. J31TS4]|uniref:heptaprenyl diphosphate synthase component 1 n=1 Tax=Paenibacillus sp. J31TS4 TaxID=2807195 RepID=UPI001B0D9913|nr:heptaprenyl diphosphate synthase component 1 [Paenibacillus sp. J31TS4]GIP37475.1 hypothetical protein J31TS4_07550 [Paenibacillus sp. J31TS4]
MTTSRIQDMAKPYIEYDMILSHTSLPDFPEARAGLLLAFMKANGIREESGELYALVTSLVQLGMDTHDLVPESSERKEQTAARSRQLKVLAGDYFSARFYQLLSQAGQIEVIRQLSQSICEANRLKMNLYQRMKQLKLSAEDYLEQSVAIKTQLFRSFNSMFKDGTLKLWPDILEAFTRCEVLARELLSLDKQQPLRFSWAFWHLLQKASREERRTLLAEEPEAGRLKAMMLKYDVRPHLHDLLADQLEIVMKLVGQISPKALADELSAIGDTFRGFVQKPRLIEEH